RCPNTESGGKSANNILQVGGAPTYKQAESQLTIMCKLGCGPQQIEFGFPISTDNVSCGCTTINIYFFYSN
uniref:hypothetical protein n=1 Tax=Staphylococcus aureus TaxID=1280 RepID=UPI001BFD8880